MENNLSFDEQRMKKEHLELGRKQAELEAEFHRKQEQVASAKKTQFTIIQSVEDEVLKPNTMIYSEATTILDGTRPYKLTVDSLSPLIGFKNIDMLTACIDSIQRAMFLTAWNDIISLDDNESTDVLHFLSKVRWTTSMAWSDISAFYKHLGVTGLNFNAKVINGTQADSKDNRQSAIGLYLQLLPESRHTDTFAPQVEGGKYAQWWIPQNVEEVSTGNDAGLALGPFVPPLADSPLVAKLPDSPMTLSPY
jgi:hypothetical protein